MHAFNAVFVARPAVRSAWAFSAVLAALTVVASPARAVTSNWTNNSGGSFRTAANWNNGVPLADDIAVFDRGSGVSYTVTFHSPSLAGPIASDRLIVGSNTVTFDPAIIFSSNYFLDNTNTNEIGILGVPVRGITIGADATDTAAVLISHLSLLQAVAATLGHGTGSHGTLTLNQTNDVFHVTGGSDTAELIVGLWGTGVLNVSNGADVIVDGTTGIFLPLPAGSVSLGRNSSGNGTANITGAGSTLEVNSTLVVGDAGTGTLNVTAGGLVEGWVGIVGSQAGSTGRATVSGAGSKWNVGLSLLVGDAGTGVLNVGAGGLVESSSGTVGSQAGSTGRATVSGIGSRWNVNGNFEIGASGNGTLEITGGGRVVVNGAAGTNSYIGRNANSVGEVLLITTTTSRWDNSRSLLIGNGDGSQGTLTIARGVVTNLDGTLGAGLNSTGTATVTNTGSIWSNGGELRIGRGVRSIGTLRIEAGGVVVSSSGVLGDATDSEGTVTVTGSDGQGNVASWTANGVLIVGSSGAGTLTVEDGGYVSSVFSLIGIDADSSGTVTVRGADAEGNRSTWTVGGPLSVGIGGEAKLLIEAGGQVFNTDAFVDGLIENDQSMEPNVTVTGADGDGNPATWTNNGLLVVGSARRGALMIDDGGRVANVKGVIGDRADSVGEVTVHGELSTWTNSGDLVVGDAGMGTLNILDGGSVSNINGSIGDMDGDGTVTASGIGSTWINDNELLIGAGANGVGRLTIEAGGRVSDKTGSIGFDADSVDNIVLVTGAGSTWTHADFLRVGDSGEGKLTIADGGHVTNDGDGLVAAGTNSEGTVTVTGDGSTWTSGGDLDVGNGDMSDGKLYILAGGAVSNENGTIGNLDGAEGSVTVTHATWTNSMDLIVGNEDMSDGKLNINSGGTVSNFSGNIGNNAGSEGTVTVSGQDAMWTNNGTLRVGFFGKGTLTIDSGGSMSNPNAAIAAAANSTGTATIGGAGSTWTTNGRLSVGGDAPTNTNGGTGTLRIQPGATLSVAQDIVLFPDGLVDFEGGTLSAASVGFQGGGQFDWTGGTLHVGVFNGNLVNQGGTLAPGQSPGSTAIIGNYTQQANATLQIEIGGTLVNAEHDFVNVTGIALLGGELELTLIDAFVPNPIDTFTIFNTGTLLNFFSNVTNRQRLDTTDGLGSFLVHYGPTSAFGANQIVLTDFELAGLPGDYNNDGKVDAADFVVWRNGMGTSYTQADFELWRANFGATAAGAAAVVRPGSNTAVPEPGVLMFALSGLVAVLTRYGCLFAVRRLCAGARRHCVGESAKIPLSHLFQCSNLDRHCRIEANRRDATFRKV